jgi:hypothetical protein
MITSHATLATSSLDPTQNQHLTTGITPTQTQTRNEKNQASRQSPHPCPPLSAPKPTLSTNKDEEIRRGARHHLLQFPILASARISKRIKPAAPSMSCRSRRCVVARPIGGFRFMQKRRNEVVFGLDWGLGFADAVGAEGVV